MAKPKNTVNIIPKKAVDKIFTRAFFEVVQTHMVCQSMARSSASVASDAKELQRCFFCESEDW